MFSNCLPPADELADADGDGELEAEGDASFELPLLEPHPASTDIATTEAATIVTHFFGFIS
ncbi:hypothetical protein D3C87_2061890 [compost metagenome]